MPNFSVYNYFLLNEFMPDNFFSKAEFDAIIRRDEAFSKKPLEERVKLGLEGIKRLEERLENPVEIEVLGLKLLLLPTVFCPYFIDSRLLAQNQGVSEGEDVLEIGCGSGLQAIIAAKKAKRVVATDINRKAIECAGFNAKRHGVEGKTEFRQGSLFSPLRQDEKFDLIICNPPFYKGEGIGETYSQTESFLESFFKNVSTHLKKGARIIMIYSEAGDVKLLHELIERHGFQEKTVAESREEGFRKFILEIKRTIS